MNRFKMLLLMFVILITSIKCSDNDLEVNQSPPANLEVQNFIWKGLNLYYLWQGQVPNLADTRFKNQTELNIFLKDYPKPEVFFESLIYDRTNTDKWSWIVDDYIALEQSFQGITKNNGVEFGLVGMSNGVDVFGFVRYIIPGSDASSKNIKRGDIFWGVNGTQLTRSNYSGLLFGSAENYTLNLGTLSGGVLTQGSTTVSLTKTQIQENPVFITKSFDTGGKKIGYLMYNAFTRDFDKQLNNAILQLKTQGINELILDLRYNSGGSVSTAIYLSSMITGQFKGQLFTKEHWNAKIQEYFEKNDPTSLVSNFTDKMSDGTALNHLNLTKLYVITTSSSASASELVMNGLKPYITVKSVGKTTSGKYTASVTLYDSENFTRTGANPNHKWAMQPIVLQEKNKLGENSPTGFVPDVNLPEDYANMGILGDINEPLLAKTISYILTGSRYTDTSKIMEFPEVYHTKKEMPFGDNMYIQRNVPLIKILNQ
ncbi:MAG: S41 family peptidase [Flavobacteriaceae bacterium]|nr:S41 family peptidase [Flavobacteriaceae bacterium]